MKRDRSELEKNLKEVLQQVKHNNKLITTIREELLKNKITYRDSQSWISGETQLSEIEDIEKLCLLTMATYLHTLDLTHIDSSSIDPNLYFNPAEIRNSEVYKEIKKVKTLEFPYTFKSKMIKIKSGHYVGSTSAQELYELNQSALIYYNWKCQRAAVERTSKEDPTVTIRTPKLSQGNIKEMAKLMQTGRLESTEIVLNARLGTATEGEELLYDEGSMMLTITENVFLDIIDGMNRLSTVSQVLSDSLYKDLDMNFEVRILNVDEESAIEHFSQINKGLAHSKSSLEQKNTSEIYSFITNRVKDKSELRDKISLSERIPQGSNFLVSFFVLKDAIRSSFKVDENDKPEALKVSKFLTEFFNELMMEYPDAFMTSIAEVRKESLINSNQMFYGFCVIASKLYYENLPVGKFNEFIKQINFSRDNNSLWTAKGILDKNGNITSNPKKRIQDIFKELEIEVGV